MKKKHQTSWLIGIAFTVTLLSATAAFGQETSQAATTATGTGTDAVYRAIGLGTAAALAVSLSIIGASYAVGRIGSAAVGALVEKPELLPRVILLVALGEGLAVLGFAFAMMLLQKM